MCFVFVILWVKVLDKKYYMFINNIYYILFLRIKNNQVTQKQ